MLFKPSPVVSGSEQLSTLSDDEQSTHSSPAWSVVSLLAPVPSWGSAGHNQRLDPIYLN